VEEYKRGARAARWGREKGKIAHGGRYHDLLKQNHFLCQDLKGGTWLTLNRAQQERGKLRLRATVLGNSKKIWNEKEDEVLS